jgi:murein DD-endopeptidase MepM/ murein hydrolase activator NlpD
VFCEDAIHTVKSGDTLYSLAKKYGVKQDDILKINNISDSSKIGIGQKLKIPNGTSVIQTTVSQTTAGTTTINHKVAGGETFFGIAKKYNITVDQILAANNFSKSYVLKLGTTIKIPGQKAASNNSTVNTTTVVSKTNTSTPINAIASKTPAINLKWPVVAKEASYMSGKLSGVALIGTLNEDVKCIANGNVISAGPYRGFGYVVIVQCADSYLYVYGGMDRLGVKVGERVLSGTTIGRLGVDAVSNKPQLFFMVYKNNKPVDPVLAPRT